jgi:zinc transporter 1/2/3
MGAIFGVRTSSLLLSFEPNTTLVLTVPILSTIVRDQLITPVGIAIGMGVHGSYNANSPEALLSIGVLDSISAGLLLYSGIVEMCVPSVAVGYPLCCAANTSSHALAVDRLVHDFMHGELASARPSRVLIAFASLLSGALCMSVLGVWA